MTAMVAVALALLVVIVLAVGSSLLGMRAFHGSDILESFSPWRTAPPDGVVPTNPLIGDTVDSILPAKKVFRDSLEAGSFGWWNPYQLGGQPLAAVPNESVFSPLNLPYWVVPLWYGPGLVKLIELAVAVGFTALFLRRLELGLPASVLGGFLYAFSGFQVVWNNWSQAHVGALIAALFWSIEVAISKRRIIWALPLAVVVATMWFEGFPSVTGYGLFFGGVYAVVRAVSLGSLRRIVTSLSRPALGVIVGTCLAAIQLIPFYASLSAIDLGFREQTSAAHLPLRTLATVILPNAFGSPVDGVYFGPGNYIEIQSFAGIVAVGLAIFAVAYGRSIIERNIFWFFVASLVLVGVLLWVGGPLLALFQEIPLFSLNFIGRLRSIFGFFVVVLASVGFEAILRGRPRAASWRNRTVFIGGVAVSGLVLGFAIFRAWQTARTFEQLDYFHGELRFIVFVLGLGVVAAVFVHLGRSRWFMAGVVAMPLVAALEITRFAVPFLPQVPIDEFYPTTTAHSYLREAVGNDRVAVAGLALYPSTTSFYGLRSVTGHTFHAPEWQELLEAVDPEVMRASPTFSILSATTDLAASPVLDRLAAGHFVTDPRVATAGDRERLHERNGSVILDPGRTFTIPTEGDVIRAIGLWIEVGFDPGAAVDEFLIEAIDGEGRVLSAATRRFDKYMYEGSVDVSIPEVSGAAVIRLSYRGDSSMTVAAASVGGPLFERVVAADDGLRLVHSSGAVVYERLGAMSRARWAGRSMTVPLAEDRVEVLRSGVDPDVVVLSADAPQGSGGRADLTIVRDDFDGIDMEIRADGRGFVVIADTITDDWVATLDGVEVTIVEADHALAAVAVPDGDHELQLRYRPPSLGAGAVVSVAAVLLSALIAGVSAVRASRWSVTSAKKDSDDEY